jgi:site-specific recombinase XerD
MTAQPAPIPVPFADDPLLRVALAAHLGRYRGAYRVHTESDLHVYLRWCAECNVQPLAARRADVELYVRWLQEVRRFKLSTVSRRLSRRLKHLTKVAGVKMPRMHPHMLRHTYVTTMLDAGVPLRDVQIAARHADPRTTMRYDRARKNLDRHPNYILAAFMASGT